eukprot:g72345.t1
MSICLIKTKEEKEYVLSTTEPEGSVCFHFLASRCQRRCESQICQPTNETRWHLPREAWRLCLTSQDGKQWNVLTVDLTLSRVPCAVIVKILRSLFITQWQTRIVDFTRLFNSREVGDILPDQTLPLYYLPNLYYHYIMDIDSVPCTSVLVQFKYADSIGLMIGFVWQNFVLESGNALKVYYIPTCRPETFRAHLARQTVRAGIESFSENVMPSGLRLRGRSRFQYDIK